MKRLFNRFLLPILIALSFVTPSMAQADQFIQALTGRNLYLTAPAGGVTAGSAYVIQNQFVVALETKSAGQSFNAIFKDAVVTLPYYQGTVYKGQHAHWYTATGKATDYEGREIGFFTEDCTPTDLVCDVMLTGEVWNAKFRAIYPLDTGGVPHEITVTMTGGNGTGAFTLPAWVEGFEGEFSTSGNWNNNGTITLTFTIPGTTNADVWTAQPMSGVLRQSRVYTLTNSVVVVMTNSSGGVVPAGTRITRGFIWKLGTREE